MKGICVEKGIVIEMKFTFRLFGCKTKVSCVYNETAENQGSFNQGAHVIYRVSYNRSDEAFLSRWHHIL